MRDSLSGQPQDNKKSVNRFLFLGNLFKKPPQMEVPTPPTVGVSANGNTNTMASFQPALAERAINTSSGLVMAPEIVAPKPPVPPVGSLETAEITQNPVDDNKPVIGKESEREAALRNAGLDTEITGATNHKPVISGDQTTQGGSLNHPEASNQITNIALASYPGVSSESLNPEVVKAAFREALLKVKVHPAITGQNAIAQEDITQPSSSKEILATLPDTPSISGESSLFPKTTTRLKLELLQSSPTSKMLHAVTAGIFTPVVEDTSSSEVKVTQGVGQDTVSKPEGQASASTIQSNVGNKETIIQGENTHIHPVSNVPLKEVPQMPVSSETTLITSLDPIVPPHPSVAPLGEKLDTIVPLSLERQGNHSVAVMPKIENVLTISTVGEHPAENLAVGVKKKSTVNIRNRSQRPVVTRNSLIQRKAA